MSSDDGKEKLLPRLPLGRKSSAMPLTSTMLKVVVGAEDHTRTFFIHESLLTSRSKFFKKAMGKGWKEAEEKLVCLPDDDPAIFAIYEQVTYTGQIPLFDDESERIFISDVRSGSNGTTCTSLEKCQHEYEALADLYVLAEKLQDLKARNTTVEAIIQKVTHEVATVTENPCLPSLAAITTVYSKTPRHCPGRQVLLDCFTFYAEDESLPETGNWNTLPREFLYDMAQDALSYRTKPKKLLPHERVDRYLEDEDETLKWDTESWWYELWLPKEK